MRYQTATSQRNSFMSQATLREHAPTDGYVLQVIGVGKIFRSGGPEIEALRPITINVKAGEFICLLGPSGCGKSTLLNIIAGLESSSSGEVLSNGQAVTGPGSDRVMLFQDAALFPWLDVQHNVEFGLRQAGRTASERAKITKHMIQLVNLTGFERSYTHQLSGGMRQRVAIARALAINPSVLLMDEPFAALDALTRDKMHSELEQIWSTTNKTILFVTHNVREAVALGDRVFVFSARPGSILQEFRITLPRPRLLEDHALVTCTSEIMAVLRQDERGLQKGQSNDAS
jgi:NitT/TauT family transport system ATP-binding protein